MVGKRIAFPIKTKEQGQRTYQSGLKHRVLTAPSTPGVGIGEQVEVELQLQYADRVFILPGQVMHTGEVATIVQLDTLPAEALEVLGQRAQATPRPDGIERTEDSPDTTRSQPVTPSSELEETLCSVPADPYGGQPVPSAPVAPSPEPASAPTAPPVEVEAATEPAPEAPVAPAEPAPAAAPRKPRSQPMSARPASAAPAGSPPPSRQAAQPATPSGGMASDQAPAAPTSSAGARAIPLPGRAVQTVPGAALMEGSLGERSMREIFMDLLR
ncbi:MAG: hypothetical protein QGH45_03415, partial [Myxococcota bacterium]|nr:hypothetical protein [Myxococcota bacterium]